jgi:UPF0716 family protein affecting phage T7 exclusion
MFRPFLSTTTGANAIYANLRLDDAMGDWSYDDVQKYTRALRALHERRTPDLCFVSFDLMDGHTLAQVFGRLWGLALASCTFCTLFAVVIARRHGLACFAALAMTYALAIAVIASLRIKVHMMLIAVFLVAPGLVTDYVMHMAYNADTKSAVAWSALISVLSIAPYAASPSRGVRDFTMAYVVFVVAGMLHAFATTCTRSMPYFLLPRPDAGAAEIEKPVDAKQPPAAEESA